MRTFQSLLSSNDQRLCDLFPIHTANLSTPLSGSISTLSFSATSGVHQWELSTNGDKPSDSETLAEVRGEAIEEEENDIDVVYDEPPAPPSAFEVEKAIEVLQQFTLFCDEGDDLREVLSKVNTYSQRAIAKRKKQKTIKDYFKL